MKKELIEFKLFFQIVLSLIFLASNSILCRLALLENYIDAYSFTAVRLISGALILYLILSFNRKNKLNISLKSNWSGGFYLFLYAITFSYSYLNIDAGVGTLILFGAVQISMILIAFIKGERVTIKKLSGFVIAFLGLIYLLIPKENFTLSLTSSILMIISGIAWGLYTINGKKSTISSITTAENFIKSSILVIISLLFFFNNINISINGFIYAFISGAITSGIGYILWYFIINKIEILTASIIQLTIPIIAIFFATILLNESITYELILSTLIILSGIFISIYKKN